MKPRIIELDEYIPKRLNRDELGDSAAEKLWREYRNQIALDYPSPKTDWQWQLTAQGWVGYIPLTAEIGFSLRPKIELSNLFRMLEYAFRLRSFKFLEGYFQSQSLSEFYERLANVLAQRVLDRSRKGFYRSYISATEQSSYVRGRLNTQHLIQKPWAVNPECAFEEHSADIDENRILAWTLFVIARSGMCSERVLPTIRRAYHSLQSFVSISPYRPQDCLNRSYSRLNEDYQPMHLLARFFLENTGPTHIIGEHQMIPFLVDTAHLFELFISEWLKAQLPENLIIKYQEYLSIGTSEDLYFKIDVVVYDKETRSAICVLDTKYKNQDKPSSSDIAQVIAYATAKGCTDAILVYPRPLARPLNEWVRGIHIRSIEFALNNDLEQAGQDFLHDLLQGLSSNS
jgi:5-methylcytosine-specific restriction enzyme subunit McrC